MTAIKSDRMSPDEFVEWCLTQEERYELVDGVPKMMTGARKAHDRIVRRAMFVLTGRLLGGSCEPFSKDVAVYIPNGQVRRADVVVDCGEYDADDLRATK